MSTRALTAIAVLSLTAFVACDSKEPYQIGLGNNWAPYDVGVKEGLNYDVLTALCDANEDMECDIIDTAYTDCIDSDASGDAIIGSKLDDGTFDGCMGWFITQTRKDLGLVFTDDYSAGLPGSLLMASSGTPPSGTDLGGAVVGLFAGFWIDGTCLGGHYSNFTTQDFSGATQRDDLLTALAGGTIDYVFWDAAAPIDPPTDTQFVGDPIGDCPDDGIALAAYGDRASDLVSDFNSGLDAIIDDGTLASLCEDAETDYGMGDPNCLLD